MVPNMPPATFVKHTMRGGGEFQRWLHSGRTRQFAVFRAQVVQFADSVPAEHCPDLGDACDRLLCPLASAGGEMTVESSRAAATARSVFFIASSSLVEATQTGRTRVTDRIVPRIPIVVNFRFRRASPACWYACPDYRLVRPCTTALSNTGTANFRIPTSR